jgi:hypothetical protein
VKSRIALRVPVAAPVAVAQLRPLLHYAWQEFHSVCDYGRYGGQPIAGSAFLMTVMFE